MKQMFIIFLIMLATTAAGWGQSRSLTVADLFNMGRVSDPQISPDGSWIAYTITQYSMDDNRSNSDIYLVSADGKQQRRLTRSPKSDAHPRWSADGNFVYFTSTRGGSSQIYRIDVRGGEAQQMTDLALDVSDFAMSADGKYFAIQTEM